MPDWPERQPMSSPSSLDESSASALSQEDQDALAEDVDIEPAARRQVLDLSSRLERMNHYELLGVDPVAADKRTIRRAYFDLAAQFHPDRYFRKRLGSFQTRMELLFGRITRAHEILSDAEQRAEYDAYLDEQRRARGIEQLLAEALAEAERAEQAIEREARAQVQASPSAPPSSAPAGLSDPARAMGPSPSRSQPPPRPRAASSPQIDPAVGPPRPRAASNPQIDPAAGPARPRAASSPQIDVGPASRPRVPSSPQIDVSVRREAFARRLLGARSSMSSTPPARASATPPAPPQTPTVADAMEHLKRRYEERVARAKAIQARKYAENGEAALARGDTIAAANAFRVAMALSPDTAFERTASQAQAQADGLLADTYARQAAYEEKTEQWAEAARSWTRVCAARPNDADAHERASSAIVKASGNLDEAGRLAARACAIAPAEARYRVTLASVYLAAGHAVGARRELETAAQLDPQDGNIQAMMQRLAP